ncbi:hypothetical protein [Aneurinibacillus migulanus]|uniref:hypothetical protein n=1 Tax=Aneurinibacillus migulanus TaxID=47500 RepID=UPI001F1C579C|nr:hypothetical protein [Aneurinibacillus migulanus]
MPAVAKLLPKKARGKNSNQQQLNLLNNQHPHQHQHKRQLLNQLLIKVQYLAHPPGIF